MVDKKMSFHSNNVRKSRVKLFQQMESVGKMKQDKSPFLSFQKSRSMFEKVEGSMFKGMSVSSSVIKGHLDYLSAFMLTILAIMFAFSATWKDMFPSTFNLLLIAMVSMMFSGLLLHEVFWGSDKSALLPMVGEKSVLQMKRKVSTYSKVMMFGVCFSAVTFSQILMKVLFSGTENVVLMSSFRFDYASFYGAIAIVEECFFAWLIFPFCLVFMSRGKLALPVALLSNAMIFTAFHGAVWLILHIGDQAFLPAMFMSRVALDLFGYYMTDGTLGVSMSSHFLGNVTAQGLFRWK